MKGASNMLDQLLAGGGGDLLNRAKQGWDSQSTGTKGAVAGGLLAVLFGAGRGGLGSVAKVGGAALIGSLASRAFADYQAGKPPLAAISDVLGLPEGMLTGGEAEQDAMAARLLRAMIAAAKADGTVTPEEQAKITGQATTLGFTEDAKALIEEELAAPTDPARIAAFATTPDEAAQIYTASLMVVNPEGAAEKAYLAALAEKLGLEPGLVAHLNAQAGALLAKA